MQSSPAKRCEHVHTTGVQCGSPALQKLHFCYYHQQSRSHANQYYSEAPFTALEDDFPVFEDAHSIQIAVRQVASLLLRGKIEHKTAGLILYALQIASSNLKRFTEEKPQPSQVVVEISDSGVPLHPIPLETSEVKSEAASANASANKRTRKNNKKDKPSEEQIQRQLDYLIKLGQCLDEPYDKPNPELDRLRRLANLDPVVDAPEDLDGELPPGSIQACIGRPKKRRQTYVI